jgi:hypothetical protein
MSTSPRRADTQRHAACHTAPPPGLLLILQESGADGDAESVYGWGALVQYERTAGTDWPGGGMWVPRGQLTTAVDVYICTMSKEETTLSY